MPKQKNDLTAAAALLAEAAASDNTEPTVGNSNDSIERAGNYNTDAKWGITVDSRNPTVEQAKASIVDAMEAIIAATTLMVNIPDPEGEHDIEFASDEQNGEVEVVKCRQANRYSRMQRGLLDQLLRQLTYAVEAERKEFESGKRQLQSMFNTLTRADDPARIRDAMEKKAGYLDLVKERWAHAQNLLDAANVAYIDLTGTAYVPYEQRVARRNVAVPAAPQSDPVLARCADLIRS